MPRKAGEELNMRFYQDVLQALVSGRINKAEFDAWVRSRLSELRQTLEVSLEQRLLSELELLSEEASEGIRPIEEFQNATRRIFEGVVAMSGWISEPSWVVTGTGDGPGSTREVMAPAEPVLRFV